MSRQVVKIPRHNAKCNKYTVRPNFTSWTPASENEVGNYGSFRNLKDESLRLKSARREARFLLSWKICNSATGCSTSPFKLWALVMPGCEHFTQFLSQPDFVIIQTHTGEMWSTERLQSCEGCTEEAQELHEAKGPAAAVDAASLSAIR